MEEKKKKKKKGGSGRVKRTRGTNSIFHLA